MRWLVPVILLACACACPSKQSAGASTSGSGTQTGSAGGGPPAGGCESIRAKVEGLYRTEAQAKEPARVDEAVADNTAMVLGDCAKNPGPITTCVQAAANLKDVEACLPQLDDEGSEGDHLAH